MSDRRWRVASAAVALVGLTVVAAGVRAAVGVAGAEHGQFAWWVDAVPPFVVAVLVGGSAVVAGVRGYYGSGPRYAASVLVGTAAPAALVVFDAVPDARGVPVTGVQLLVTVGVVAGGAAWHALGWYWEAESE